VIGVCFFAVGTYFLWTGSEDSGANFEEINNYQLYDFSFYLNSAKCKYFHLFQKEQFSHLQQCMKDNQQKFQSAIVIKSVKTSSIFLVRTLTVVSITTFSLKQKSVRNTQRVSYWVSLTASLHFVFQLSKTSYLIVLCLLMILKTYLQ